jgi:uncharacterized protein YqeY
MATIKEKLAELMKASMKSGDKETLAFTRNIHAVIRKREIDDKVELDDAGVQKIIGSLIKQRQDSIEQYKAGNRPDLVAKEEAELNFQKSFMPEQMSEAEIRTLIDWAVKESGAATGKDIGKVMGLLKVKVSGKADGKLVNQLVKEKLGG